IPGRNQPDYHAADLLSDVLGRSRSSRLFTKLVKETPLFSSINAYVTGSIDPGLLIINGRLNEDVDLETANTAVESVIEDLRRELVSGEELRKVKNQAESTLVFSEMELLNRAMNLAYSTLLGNPDLINQESEQIQAVKAEDVLRMADALLAPDKSNTLFYEAKN
ncbi:MAG: M16 family metallopeptidase, partial [Cyclobacteriaceae bacterium]